MSTIRVQVIPVFKDGIPVSVELPDGATAGDAGSKIGAPSGCTYRVNNASATASTTLGNGDSVVINRVKYDAGC